MVEIFDNIRKIYCFKPPSVELADYIEFFSESCSEATHNYFANQFTVKMFASFTPTFWINLGPQYSILMANKRRFILPGQDVLIVRDSIVERQNLPDDYIFTVKFRPGALDALLGIDQSRFINDVIDLRLIVPPALLMRLRQVRNFEHRVRLFEEFLLTTSKTVTRNHCLQMVKDTIACYEAGDLQYNVTEMACKLFTTSKSINRYFTRVIGTTPKNFFLITRARTALTAYVSHGKAFIPSDFGYYDMSHFYKNVLHFTGQKLSIQTA